MSWHAPHPQRIPTADDIHFAKSRIKELQATIKEIEHEQTNLIAFISPFRRLPAEILCEIVGHCIDDGMSPSTLNQISSPMRQAVNGFKSLWTNICIAREPEEYNKSITCRNREYLQVVLERAAPLPLGLSFEAVDLFPTFFATLIPFSQYLRVITLTEAREFHSVSMLGIRASSLVYWPSTLNLAFLEEVNINVRQDPSVQIARKVLDIIGASDCSPLRFSISIPSLSILHPAFKKASTLCLYDHPSSGWLSRLSRPNLNHLELLCDDCVLRHLDVPNLEFLSVWGNSSTPNLYIEDIPSNVKYLELGCIGIYRRDGESRTRWNFPNLKEIEMDSISLHIPSLCISAPRLERLKIEGDEENPPNSTSYPYCLFGHNAVIETTTLRTLELTCVVLIQELLQGLKSHLDLRDLQVKWCKISFLALKSLSKGVVRGEDSFFPKLERLTIERSEIIEEDHTLEEFKTEFRLNRPSVQVSVIISY